VRWIRVVLSAAAVGLAAPSLAKDAPASEWVQKPSKEMIARAEPAAGRAGGNGGRAAMTCAVEADGALKDCRLVLERPAAQGYGKALLSLAPHYRRDVAKYPGAKVTVAEDWYEFDTPPDWLKRPTPNDLMAVFPTEALRRGRSGQTGIECTVTVQGALSDCVVLWEKPEGSGFGGAAIALTPQFLMKPATRDGRPVESTARFPINFKTFGPAASSELKRVAPSELAWAQAPSYADVVAAYPAKARSQKRGGRATVECQMTSDGRMRDCRTITEQPKGLGFGAAAKDLAKTFRVGETSEEVRKVLRDVVVHLPFAFDPVMLSGETQVVGKPSWAKLPTADDMKAAIGPLKLAATTRVQLECVVQPGGAVGDCRVASEAPAGSGVGAAALTLAPRFRLTTWTSEGLPVVGGKVRIPLRFEP